MSRFPRLHVVSHPLVAARLTEMRRRGTPLARFRACLREITLLMAHPLLEDLEVQETDIVTPVCPTRAPVLRVPRITVVPVLRAGLGMSGPLLELLPEACEGMLGLYRNERHEPVEYLVRLPAHRDGLWILCDPMLATGGSAVHAVDVLLREGVPADSIRFLSLLAAPEGVERLHRHHPDLPVWTASLDERLNEHAFIVPGLGDAGDRLFGTEA